VRIDEPSPDAASPTTAAATTVTEIVPSAEKAEDSSGEKTYINQAQEAAEVAAAFYSVRTVFLLP
jgi:hypothetical protein